MSREKPSKFKISSSEGAIVFKDKGVEFYYPAEGTIELRETFEFLTFAMIKQDWMAEWYEYLNAAEALADLAGIEKEPAPCLRVIEGGKSNEDK